MTEILLKREDTYSGCLILVSPGFPLVKLPDEKKMCTPLRQYPEVVLQPEAAGMLKNLLYHIRAGKRIALVSGFRTQDEQEQIWEESIQKKGEDFTRQYVAMPGHSEHQTGLAVDLGEKRPRIDFIRPAFPEAGICGSFRKYAQDFGFIQRYQEGKEPVTGISPEPWHFRYVGIPHSVIMTEMGLTLEEYISFLKRNTDRQHPYVYQNHKDSAEIFYQRTEEDSALCLSGSFRLSGTNEGGVVVTRWKEQQKKSPHCRRRRADEQKKQGLD